MRVLLFAALVAVQLLSLQAADAPLKAGEDPLEWSPPKAATALPALIQSTPELEARMRSALVLASKRAENTNGPASRGSTILYVIPNSQASAFGLAPGDVILKVDGQEVRGLNDTELLRQQVEHKLAIVSGGQTREYTFKSGRLGFNLGAKVPFDDPVPGPFDRDARWNADMDLFTALYATDPQLAEIALVQSHQSLDLFEARWPTAGSRSWH